MSSGAVHITMPVEAAASKPQWRSLGMMGVACACCFLLGYQLATPAPASEVTLLTAPAQRVAVNAAQPNLAGPQGRPATAVYNTMNQAAAQVGLVPLVAAEPRPAVVSTSEGRNWLALGLLVPALTAVYMAFGRRAAEAPTSVMAAAYGTARENVMRLRAVPEGAAAETVAEEALVEEVAGEYIGTDLSQFEEEDGGKGRGRRGKGKGKGGKGKGKGKGKGDEMREQVIQVRRVTKVVKGGKLLKFRAVVVVGDGKGKVAVGCASHKEVMGAVQKASREARKEMITVPLNKNGSFPHPMTTQLGAAQVWMSPACEGTGVVAGGAVRAVMEAAGVRNCLAKQQGTDNPLSNARCTIKALSQMRTLREVAEERGVELSQLLR